MDDQQRAAVVKILEAFKSHCLIKDNIPMIMLTLDVETSKISFVFNPAFKFEELRESLRLIAAVMNQDQTDILNYI